VTPAAVEGSRARLLYRASLRTWLLYGTLNRTLWFDDAKLGTWLLNGTRLGD
jgi:hypothetical protein